MPNYTVCAYDLQGVVLRPGSAGWSYTHNDAAYAPHELVVNDDDQWADSQSPLNENGLNATYVSGSGEAGWTPGDVMDLNAIQILSGSDGSTITLGWLQSEQDGAHQMISDAPLQDGVTYTEVSYTASVPGTTYQWSDFNFAHTVPCFTTGMEIRTKRGNIAVEDLQIGDMVWTLDNGYQELKFIGRQKHLAMGAMTPVLFKKGIIGNTKDIVVSQHHRFHVASLPAELANQFGEHTDSLLQAIDFCDGVNVRLYPEIKEVEYFHLMFDNHELLECHGTISESWQPTQKALKQNPAQAEELLAIFPGIDQRFSRDPGGLVRHELRLKRA